jgi:hypothetical protein
MAHLDVEAAHQLLKGGLSDSARSQYQAHVARCRTCRELVEREQRWLRLLKLDAVAISSGEAVDRALDQVVTAWAPKAAARRRRRREAAALVVLTTLVAAVFATIGFARANSDSVQSARRLGITLQLQSEVVRHLSDVQTLSGEPWLVDDYLAVRELSRLLGKSAAAGPLAAAPAASWERWKALPLREQVACVRCYQQVAQRPDGNEVLAHAAAFAGLTAAGQDTYRALEKALQATLHEQPSDQRRRLLALPGTARALAVFQIMQARLSSVGPPFGPPPAKTVQGAPPL